MGHMRLNDVVAEIVGEVIAGRAINKRQAAVNRWDDIDADGQYLAGIDGVVTRIDTRARRLKLRAEQAAAPEQTELPFSLPAAVAMDLEGTTLVSTRQLTRAEFARAAKLIDKVKGEWVEINPMNQRLVRQEVGAKHDAERDRKGDVICSLLQEEALQGRMYTMTLFAETFENTAGLGGQSIIRERLNVLTTKGYVKFVRGAAATALDLAAERSKYGYLCVEAMRLATSREHVAADTGEITSELIDVLPSHYKCPHSGAVLPVENPSVWVYRDTEEAR